MGLFKNILSGSDILELIENKDFVGLLKASAKKDPEVRKQAILAFGGLGESARTFLWANLAKSDDLQNVRSAAVLKELGWSPSGIEEKILYLMGLNSWEELASFGEQAGAPLTRIIKAREPGDSLRSAALIVLGHIHKPAVIQFIVDDFKATSSANALDAYIAAGCLKRMGSEAVAPLISILYDESCSQQTRVWATQVLAMIGRPAVGALIAINKAAPGKDAAAIESWAFSLQALAGTADDGALQYIKTGAYQALMDLHASGRTRGLTTGFRSLTSGSFSDSEATKAVQTLLDIFKDPPRSIIKYSRLGGPMRDSQIVAILALGNRHEAQALKGRGLTLLGGTGIAEGVFGSTNTVTMDALDKIGGDEATKAMVDFIQSNIGPERRTKAMMMVDKNAHPSMLEYLKSYNEKSAVHFLDRAAASLTLIHLNARSDAA